MLGSGSRERKQEGLAPVHYVMVDPPHPVEALHDGARICRDCVADLPCSAVGRENASKRASHRFTTSWLTRRTLSRRSTTARLVPRVPVGMAGHANVSITLNTYSHVVPTLHDDAASTVERLMRDR